MIQNALILLGFALAIPCALAMFYFDDIRFSFLWCIPVALGFLIDLILLIRERLR